MITDINKELLDNLSQKAKLSPRLRTNHNFHKEANDPLQRMLNAMEPGTYVRPHKHENPDKREVFIALRGQFIVIEFDNTGNIINHLLLNTEESNFGCELSARSWHTILPLTNNAVAYELKDGPYAIDTDKYFAPWAPHEDMIERFEFVRNWLTQLNLAIPEGYNK